MSKTKGHRRGLRRSLALSASIVVWLAVAGVALAYFTGSGFGTGTGSVANSVSATVTAATASADLHPGATGSVSFTLTNGYGEPQSFNQVTAASVTSNDPSNCPDANVSIAPSLPYTFAPAVNVGPNTTSGSQAISGLVKLDSNAPNGCEGVSFTVTLTLSGTFG